MPDTSMQHLPTPYEVAGHFIRTKRGPSTAEALDGQLVAELDHRDPKCQATAAFIVRAVNSHEQLVAALREAEAFMAGFEGDDMQEGIDAKLEQMRTALAAAEA